jgi:spermidine synthase
VAAALAIVVAGAVAGGWVLARVAPVSATNESGERVLFRADTQYHRITVTEANNVRHLRFDASNQSAIDLSDGYRSTIAYPNYFDLALAIKPDAKRVLVLGMGGGAVTKRWWRDYPGMSIDSVEIDPVVVDVARRYFGLPDDPRLGVFATDARRFVQTADKTYDVVIVDAYYADSLPFHLTTTEFLREVKSRMAPDGVLAYNVISPVSGDGSKLFRTTYRTAGGVWDHLWAFPIGLSADGAPDKRRNVIVLASDADVTKSELLRRIETRVDGQVKLPEFPGFSADLYSEIVPLGDVPAMTDAFAPTDSLINVR